MTITEHQPFFEPLPVHDYHLKPQRVDIWQFSLLDIPDDYQSVLNSDERLRGERFHFPIHRRRHLAAHTNVRKILARYLAILPSDIEYIYNAHGKPQVANNTLVHFNLSHSQDVALLAVGAKHPVGIDLEFFSARPYEGIGSHIFSEQENHQLQQLPCALKPLGFFHLWAQKEALIKACGLGLSYPTKQLTLPTMPPANQSIYDTLHQTHWRVVSFMPTVGCCAALCAHSGVSEIRFTDKNT